MKIYKANKIIAVEGESSKEIFMLVQGRVGVYKGIVKVAEFTEGGTLFGELSGILNKPRTASLIALEDTQLMVLDRNIDELRARYPEIFKNILIQLARRVVETTEKLATANEFIHI
jgi:CRP-like cAMP-binding protein